MTKALVLQQLCVGAETVVESVTFRRQVEVLDDDGAPVYDDVTGHALTKVEDVTEEVEVERKVYASPGDVIDVSGWAHLDAYVSTGRIQIIPPTPEELQAKAEALKAEAEALKEPEAEVTSEETPEEEAEETEKGTTKGGRTSKK